MQLQCCSTTRAPAETASLHCLHFTYHLGAPGSCLEPLGSAGRESVIPAASMCHQTDRALTIVYLDAVSAVRRCFWETSPSERPP